MERNPGYESPKIALVIRNVTGHVMDAETVRIGSVDGGTAYHRFNQIAAGIEWLKYLSSDNDP